MNEYFHGFLVMWLIVPLIPLRVALFLLTSRVLSFGKKETLNAEWIYLPWLHQYGVCYTPAINLIWGQDKSNTLRWLTKKMRIGCLLTAPGVNKESFMQFQAVLSFELRTSDCMPWPLALASLESFLVTWPHW